MTTILAVDDEEFNLDIISDYLQHAGYEVIVARTGEEALEQLRAHSIDLLVLDRMMPGLSGMQLVERMNAEPKLAEIPVIMQTAAASSEQIVEGIRAGVYYYLTKPYDKGLLLSIVQSALQQRQSRSILKNELQRNRLIPPLIRKAEFSFRTLEEVNSLSYFVAHAFPRPEVVVRGLKELMTNAVEHGNLGITYNEKAELLSENCWQQEVERRLQLPENQQKHALLQYERGAEAILVRIQDCGPGFNWKKYIDFDPIRLTDPNGRGIAMTHATSFTSMQYLGNGNEVLCTLSLALEQEHA